MNSLETFCDSWLSAWTGNKPQTLLNFYHEDIIYKDPGLSAPIIGKENLRIYLQKLLAKNPSWVWKRRELFPIENGFTLIWEMEKIGGMDLVILKENKITRNEVYFDLSNFKMTPQNLNQTN
jgi:hypothetical protein